MNEEAKQNLEDGVYLQDLAKEREQEVRAALLQPPPRFKWKTDVPELRKQLLIILTRLSEIRRLLYRRVQAMGPTEMQLCESALITEVSSYQDGLDSATDHADLLERTLISLADRAYLQTLLIYEAHYDDKRGEFPWSQFLPREDLNNLLSIYKDLETEPPDHVQSHAVERLTFIAAKRAHIHHRHARARLQLKNVFLKRLALILGTLFVILCFVTFLNAGQNGLLLAITGASAGALGSALAVVLKVRDELSRIGDLRLFGNAMIVQPLVGASAGLLLYMVLETGLPGFGVGAGRDLSWSTLSLYAFIAGFSEPFFLGIVQRVASAGDRKATGKPTDAKE